MEDPISNYIKNKNKIMGKENFNIFIESDEYNDMDDNSKRITFYMVTFIMSINEYKKFKDIIKDFINIILFIKENDYLQNFHEIYENLLLNYFNKIKEIIPIINISEKKEENEFIEYLREFIEEIQNIYIHK